MLTKIRPCQGSGVGLAKPLISLTTHTPLSYPMDVSDAHEVGVDGLQGGLT